MASDTGSRLNALRESTSRAKSSSVWQDGIRGLALISSFLRSIGASAGFLDKWIRGVHLHAREGAAQDIPNHRSVRDHDVWV